MTSEELDKLLDLEIKGYWPDWMGRMGDMEFQLLHDELKYFEYYFTQAALSEFVKSKRMKRYPSINEIVAVVREYHARQKRGKGGNDPVAYFAIARQEQLDQQIPFYQTNGYTPQSNEEILEYANKVVEKINRSRAQDENWVVFVLPQKEEKEFVPATRKQIAELEQEYGWPPRPKLKDVPRKPNLQNKKIHEEAGILGVKK